MKIKKYQSGGITYLPTVNRIEGAATTAASSSSSSSESSKVPGFAKEIISLIKENGIESDVDVFLSSLQRTLDVAGDPTGENLSMRDILRVLKDVNKVKQNHDQYLTAEKSLEAQDAWAEPATDARGYLYVMDSDRKVSRIHPSEYDPEKYVSLTNLDLMHIRQIDPSKAYDSEILKNLSSAVGMKTISDYARSVIKDFGKTDITGYSEKTAGKIKSGMDKIIGYGYDDLSKLLFGGPDGVYKTNKVGTIADEDIRLALDYLKSSLPNSYRNTLNAKATAEGYNPDLMLITMLRADTDRKISVDYDHTASEDAGIGGAGAAKEKEQLTQGTLPDEVARGTGLQQSTLYLSPEAERVSDKSMMALQAWNAFPLVDEHKKPLYRNNLQELLPQIYNIRGADYSQITFGNQVVDSNDLKALVWDGKSQVKRVALPKKMSENGEIVPDLDLLIAYNEILAEVSDKPGMSKLEIQQKLKDKLGYTSNDIIIDNDNNIIIRPEKIGFFLSFAAYANRDLLNIDDKSKKFLHHLDRTEGRALKDDYNKLVQYGKLDANKKTPKIHDVSGARGNDFYYGNIYMPINDSTQGFYLSNDQWYDKNTFRYVGQKGYLNTAVQNNTSNDNWITNYGQ